MGQKLNKYFFSTFLYRKFSAQSRIVVVFYGILCKQNATPIYEWWRTEWQSEKDKHIHRAPFLLKTMIVCLTIPFLRRNHICRIKRMFYYGKLIWMYFKGRQFLLKDMNIHYTTLRSKSLGYLKRATFSPGRKKGYYMSKR